MYKEINLLILFLSLFFSSQLRAQLTLINNEQDDYLTIKNSIIVSISNLENQNKTRAWLPSLQIYNKKGDKEPAYTLNKKGFFDHSKKKLCSPTLWSKKPSIKGTSKAKAQTFTQSCTILEEILYQSLSVRSFYTILFFEYNEQKHEGTVVGNTRTYFIKIKNTGIGDIEVRPKPDFFKNWAPKQESSEIENPDPKRKERMKKLEQRRLIAMKEYPKSNQATIDTILIPLTNKGTKGLYESIQNQRISNKVNKIPTLRMEIIDSAGGFINVTKERLMKVSNLEAITKVLTKKFMAAVQSPLIPFNEHPLGWAGHSYKIHTSYQDEFVDYLGYGWHNEGDGIISTRISIHLKKGTSIGDYIKEKLMIKTKGCNTRCIYVKWEEPFTW